MVFKNAFVFQSPNFQRRTPFILLSQYNNGTFYAQWVKLSTRLHFNVEYLHKPTSRPNNVIASHFRYQLLLGKRGTASLERKHFYFFIYCFYQSISFVCWKQKLRAITRVALTAEVSFICMKSDTTLNQASAQDRSAHWYKIKVVPLSKKIAFPHKLFVETKTE